MNHVVTISDDHVYTVEGIGNVPGVTEIMQATGLVRYWNTDDWFKERGSAVHKATHLIDQNTLDWNTVDPRIQGFLTGYMKFMEEYDMEWERGETMLFHPVYRYCGTPDRWRPLHDIKCGQGDVIQLEAYAELLRVNGIDPGPMGYLLNLNEDGTYKRIPHKFDRRLRGIWLASVTNFNYRKEKGLI